MKRKFTFLIATLFTLAFLMPPQWVMGQTKGTETYQLVFKSNSTSGDSNSAFSNNATVSNVIDQGTTYVSSIPTTNNVYLGTPSNGLKFGSSNTNGKMTFNLSNNGKVSATKIKVNARRYNADKASKVKITINGSTNTTLDITSGSFADYEWTLSSATEITSINLEGQAGTSGDRRIYIKSITVTYTTSSSTNYTVTYDCNGGTSGCPESPVTKPAGNLTLPSAPTWNGHTFLGWNDGTNTYAAGASYNLTGNTDFIGQWKLTSNLSITEQSATLSFDMYNNTTAQVIHYTTSSTGNITIEPSTSNYFTYMHDANTKTITVTPTHTTPSAQTVTINQAADDYYVAGTASFTVTITDSTPFDYGDVTFVAGTDMGSQTGSGNADSMSKSSVTVSSTKAAFAAEQYRIYKNSTTTFSTTEGMITKIEFTAPTVGSYLLSDLSTTNGNYDHGTWTGYSNSIAFSANEQVRATQIVVTVSPTSSVAFPTFSVTPGTYNVAKSVTISCATEGNTIYYTTDGTNPDNTSTVYSGAITVNENMTLKAIAYVGEQTSYVATANYYIVYETATMPFAFDGDANDIASTSGLSQNGLGSYGTSPALSFGSTGAYFILKLDAAPVSLSYDLQGRSFSGGTFKVQTSADGTTYDDLAEYTSLSNDVQSITHINLESAVRYIKWVYTTKSGGNVALGNIHASTAYDVYGAVTVDNLAPTTDKKCTIYNKGVLTVTGSLNNSNTTNLIINDGGQLLTSSSVQATMKKSINGYTNAQERSGYYLIASPMNGTEYDNTAHTNLTGGAVGYDLYAYDAANELWLNFKESSNNLSTLNAGQGYLYANGSDMDLLFMGALNTTIGDKEHLPYVADNTLKSLYLAGNTLSHNETFYVYDGELAKQTVNFLTINTTGDNFITTQANSFTARAMQGFFVQSNKADCTLTTTDLDAKSRENKNDKASMLNIMVVNDGDVIDNAIVSFCNAPILNKFYLNENSTHIYIPKGHEDYAVVRCNGESEMPVNFKAAENGTYTIDFSMDNVEFNYLHLIDNMTGIDVDLLATPSYTFEARKNDYASRFRLVFSANGVNENDNENENSDFAFISNGNIVIMNAGEATLQVIDMLGRVVNTVNVNGNASVSMNTNGVYVLRLINGDNVKTQKIVVK